MRWVCASAFVFLKTAAHRVPLPPWSSESKSITANQYLAELHSSVSSLDTSLIARLDANVADSAAHVTSAISSVIAQTAHIVPGFVASARRRARAAGKRLEMRGDEFDGVTDTLESILQQVSAGDYVLEFTEDSCEILVKLIDDAVLFPSTSTLLTPGSCTVVMSSVGEASCVDSGVDAARSVSTAVSHARWLARGSQSLIRITLLDAVGEPVYGIAPDDIECSIGSDTVGWAVSSVAVEEHTLALKVALARDCSDTASLRVKIGGSILQVELMVRTWTSHARTNRSYASIACNILHVFLCVWQAVASPTKVAAAKAQCLRVRSNIGEVTVDELTALLDVCTPALSSPEAVEDLFVTIGGICNNDSNEQNSAACVAAGFLPVVMTSLSAHGAASPSIAAKGCDVLGSLVGDVSANADVVVLSAGGLDMILSVMAKHSMIADVQEAACGVLWLIARAVSPPAMTALRESAAVELINTAKRVHARSEAVKYWTTSVLEELGTGDVAAAAEHKQAWVYRLSS